MSKLTKKQFRVCSYKTTKNTKHRSIHNALKINSGANISINIALYKLLPFLFIHMAFLAFLHINNRKPGYCTNCNSTL